MRNLLSKFFLIISAILLLSCKEHNKIEVNFALNNYSRHTDKVDMNVYLDGEILIQDTIQRKPDPEIHSFRLSSGKHELKINVLKGELEKKLTLNIADVDTLVGIFITFDYYQPDSMEVANFKNYYKIYYKPNFDTIPTSREKKILTKIVKNGIVVKDW
jgi:hypothetical protein